LRLSRLSTSGFRNLEGAIDFPKSLTLLVGENNAGKSAVVDALRLITPPRSGGPWGRWITSDDFRHSDGGKREVDTFELTATFVELTDLEVARMATCLAPSVGERCAKLRLGAQLDQGDRVRVTWYGGDSMQPGVEPLARETVQHTYLHPLRDAEADLRPGRENKLVKLLSALAPVASGERAQIEDVAAAANASLDATTAIGKARTEIQGRLIGMAGPIFSQQAGLKFADPRFDRIVAALRALAGASAPLELTENGLGYNNLLYMATLLAAINNDHPSDGTHLLLVEEPEAHLHPQLQDLLLRYLVQVSKTQTQVIASTHSPNFAAAAGVDHMTVLVRPTNTAMSTGRSPASFAIEEESLDHLRRFLDVTKASLLFARGVLLVEGIAEQLLMPQLADRVGVSLSEAGVTIVNVGGVSFAPFAALFAKERIPCRCAIVSDSDPAAVEEELEGGHAALSATAKKIKASETDTMHVFLATRTLEWDLTAAGNWDAMIKALALIKPRVAARLRTAGPMENTDRADAMLSAVANVKGRFAQALTAVLSEGGGFVVPDYIKEAILWAANREPTA
jgi:putative ATP-dependent endonuclease of OLD family